MHTMPPKREEIFQNFWNDPDVTVQGYLPPEIPLLKHAINMLPGLLGPELLSWAVSIQNITLARLAFARFIIASDYYGQYYQALKDANWEVGRHRKNGLLQASIDGWTIAVEQFMATIHKSYGVDTEEEAIRLLLQSDQVLFGRWQKGDIAMQELLFAKPLVIVSEVFAAG